MISKAFIRISATFFYLGYFPMASGTFASIFGALLAFMLHDNLFFYLLGGIVISLLGYATSGKMEDLQGQKDPSCVVIDEVAGAFIAFFLLPFKWPIILTAFFLYRAFDMFKVYPLNKIEDLGGAVGIMGDDLMAGLYTNIIMHIALRWAGLV